MAIEKLTDFTSYSDLELTGEIEKLANSYQKMKFEHAVKGLEDPRDLKTVRRNIARVNTEIRKREIDAGINVAKRPLKSAKKKVVN